MSVESMQVDIFQTGDGIAIYWTDTKASAYTVYLENCNTEVEMEISAEFSRRNGLCILNLPYGDISWANENKQTVIRAVITPENGETQTSQWLTVKDITPPTVSDNAELTGIVKNGVMTVADIDTAFGGNPVRCELLADNGRKYSAYIKNGAVAFSLPAGVKEGTLFAVDAAGNYSRTGVKVDIYTPVIKGFSGKLYMQQNTEGITLDWRDMEGFSYTVTYTITYKEGNVRKTAQIPHDCKISKDILSSEDLQPYRNIISISASVTAVSKNETVFAFNGKKLSSSVSYRDITPPETPEVYSPVSTVNTAKNGTLVFSGFDAESGQTYELVVDGRKYTGTINKNARTVTFYLPKMAAGAVSAKLYARDAAGNYSKPRTVAFQVAPAMTNAVDIRQSGGGLIVSWSPVQTAGITYKVEFFEYGAKTAFYETTATDAELSVSIFEETCFTDRYGKKITVKITACNGANSNTVSSPWLTLRNYDAEAPELPENASCTVDEADGLLTLTLFGSYSDNQEIAKYELVFNGKACKAQVQGNILTFADIDLTQLAGDYSARLYAVDTAGNCSKSLDVTFSGRGETAETQTNKIESIDFRRTADGKYIISWTDIGNCNYIVKVYSGKTEINIGYAPSDAAGLTITPGTQKYNELLMDKLNSAASLTVKVYAVDQTTGRAVSNTVQAVLDPMPEGELPEKGTISLQETALNNKTSGKAVFEISNVNEKYELVIDGRKYTGTINKTAKTVTFYLPKYTAGIVSADLYIVTKNGMSVSVDTYSLSVKDTVAPTLARQLDFRQMGDETLLLDWANAVDADSQSGITYQVEIYAQGGKTPVYTADKLLVSNLNLDYAALASKLPYNTTYLTAKVYAVQENGVESAAISTNLTVRDFTRPTVQTGKEAVNAGGSVCSSKAGTLVIDDVASLFSDNIAVKAYELVINGKKYCITADKISSDGKLTFNLPAMKSEDGSTVSGKLYAVDAAGNYSSTGITVTVPVVDGVPKMSGYVNCRQTGEDTFFIDWGAAAANTAVTYRVEIYVYGVKDPVYTGNTGETCLALTRAQLKALGNLPDSAKSLTVKVYAVQTVSTGSNDKEVFSEVKSNVLSSSLTLNDISRPEIKGHVESFTSSLNTVKAGTLVINVKSLFSDNNGIKSYELVMNGIKYTVQASSMDANGCITFNLPKMTAESKDGNSATLYAVDYSGNYSDGFAIKGIRINDGYPAMSGAVDFRQVVTIASNGTYSVKYNLNWAAVSGADYYVVEIYDGSNLIATSTEIKDGVEDFLEATSWSFSQDSAQTLTAKIYAVTGTNAQKKLVSNTVTVKLTAKTPTESPFFPETIPGKPQSTVNNKGDGKVVFSGIDTSQRYELVVDGKKYTGTVNAQAGTVTFTLPKTTYKSGWGNNLKGALYIVTKDGVSHQIGRSYSIAVADYVAPVMQNKLDFRQTAEGFVLSWAEAADDSAVEYIIKVSAPGKEAVTLTKSSFTLSDLGDAYKDAKQLTVSIYAQQTDSSLVSGTITRTLYIADSGDALAKETVQYVSDTLSNAGTGKVYFSGITEIAAGTSYVLVVDGVSYTGRIAVVDGVTLLEFTNLPKTAYGNELQGTLYLQKTVDSRKKISTLLCRVDMEAKDMTIPVISSLDFRQIDDTFELDWGKTSADSTVVKYNVTVFADNVLIYSFEVTDSMASFKMEKVPADTKALKVTVTALKDSSVTSAVLTKTLYLNSASGSENISVGLAGNTLNSSTTGKLVYEVTPSDGQYELVLNGTRYTAKQVTTDGKTTVTFSIPPQTATSSAEVFLYLVKNGISKNVTPETKVTVADSTAPKMTGVLDVRQIGANSIVLNWENATDTVAGTLTYYAKITAAGESKEFEKIIRGDVIDLTEYNLTPGTIVYVSVYASDGSNISSAISSQIKYAEYTGSNSYTPLSLAGDELGDNTYATVVFNIADVDSLAAGYVLIVDGKKYTGSINKTAKTLSFKLPQMKAGTQPTGTLYAIGKDGISTQIENPAPDSDSGMWQVTIVDTTAPKLTGTLDFRQTGSGFDLDWTGAEDHSAVEYIIQIYAAGQSAPLAEFTSPTSSWHIDMAALDSQYKNLTARVYAVDKSEAENKSANYLSASLTIKQQVELASADCSFRYTSTLNNASTGQAVFSEITYFDAKYELVIDGVKYTGTVNKNAKTVTFNLPRTAYNEGGINAVLYMVDKNGVSIGCNDYTLEVSDNVKPTLSGSLDFRQSEHDTLILDWADAVDADSQDKITYRVEIYAQGGKTPVYTTPEALTTSELTLDYTNLELPYNTTCLTAKVYAVQDENVASAAISANLTIRDFTRPETAEVDKVYADSTVNSSRNGVLSISLVANGEPLFTDNVTIRSYELTMDGQVYTVTANRVRTVYGIAVIDFTVRAANAADMHSAELVAIDAAGNRSDAVKVDFLMAPELTGKVNIIQTGADSFYASWEVANYNDASYVIEIFDGKNLIGTVKGITDTSCNLSSIDVLRTDGNGELLEVNLADYKNLTFQLSAERSNTYASAQSPVAVSGVTEVRNMAFEPISLTEDDSQLCFDWEDAINADRYIITFDDGEPEIMENSSVSKTLDSGISEIGVDIYACTWTDLNNDGNCTVDELEKIGCISSTFTNGSDGWIAG